ncbi:MAG: formate-dependent phosphoribosylglycinamide formyltransferase, partial [Steroidobacteraceae bacterium]
AAVRALVEREQPHYIVPEIEAIATDTLLELEREGWTVIPTARATRLTMDREGIRRLAAEELGLPTSPYRFASSLDELKAAVSALGLPCVVKPVMSSSGKGQSTLRAPEDIERAWTYALEGSRGRSARIIVEGFVSFDTEITLLTVRTKGEGTLFCPPVGHRQERGDYMESWQPEALSPATLARAQEIAEQVTTALGGRGLFGVELFITGDAADGVVFSEVSPRPHDTGMVTMATQDMSEFALHVRAILGLPIPNIAQHGPSASCALLVEGDSANVRFDNVAASLGEPDTALRLFGKPEVHGKRRMGVALARGASLDAARDKARRMVATLSAGVRL